MNTEEESLAHDYTERLVAFLDIMGFRNHVLQGRDKAKETIKLIDAILSHALKVIKDQDVEALFSFKLFSDCICVSAEPDKIYEVLCELAYIQAWFSINGIFLRGALSRGLHYENDHIIFSEGLIKAYEFETEAVYPRITVDPIVFDSINDNSCLEYLMEAPDGLVFIDYLSSFLQDNVSNPDELIEEHKISIVDQAKRNAGNNTILEKYRWLAGYHNMKAAEHVGEPDDWEERYYEDFRARLLIPMEKYFPSFRKLAMRRKDA